MVKLKFDKQLYLSFLLTLAVFLPQIPPLFGRSEIHINLILTFCTIMTLLIFKVRLKINELLLLIIYYSIFQLLLLISYFFGSDEFGGFSDIMSLYRPIMLFFLSLGLLNLLDNIELSYFTIIRTIKKLMIVIFLYSLSEVFFFSKISPLIHMVYRLEDKSNIDGVAVSFFTLPYYASYILSIFLLFFISNFKINKNINSLIYILICILSIVLTQSKMGIAVAFVSFFVYLYLSASITRKIFIILIFSLFILFNWFYLLEIVKFLKNEIGGNFANTTYLILIGSEHAGNLLARQEQLINTYNTIYSHNILIGAGLGKGLTLETWMASILYRYGFIGLIFFISFFLYVFFKINTKLQQLKKINIIKREVLKVVGIWAIMIFLTQLSGLMMEYSKAALYSGLMFALTSKILLKKEDIN